MTDINKAKKLRIYKFAAEYNLATDAIIDFLTDKGYKIKSHMTLLTDDMIADIAGHFKKDIESAEKHYRKVSEFQKKRVEKSEDQEADEVEESPAEETDAKEEVESKDSEIEEKEVEESAVEEVAEVEETEPEVEEAETVAEEEEPQETTETFDHDEPEVEPVVEEAEEIQVEEKAEPEQVKEKEVEVEEVTSDDEESNDGVKIFKTQSELDLRKKKTGLTVVGKIDIDKKKKPKKPKRQEKEPETVETKKAPQANAEEKTEDGSKKKKKVLKAKKKFKNQDNEENVKSKKKRKAKKLEVDKKEVEAAIKRTMASIDDIGAGGRANVRKKKRKEKAEIHDMQIQEQQEIENTILKVTEYIAVNEMANLMNVPVGEVISKCIGLGLMVSINQRLDAETITLLADEFGYEVDFQEEYAGDQLEDIEDADEELQSRPPVVTIMGHVDHGKTSLLDYIRKENVVAGEAGGITQHIGAYKVEIEDGKSIAFLDTPGHEAFTAMRARGAKVTDIVILIVAADDAVMPQTIEAINHSQAAGVPIIVAVNKIDKPGANIEKIKQQLAERNVLVEDWGGKYQCVEISAKAGTNIDLLLEKVLLEAELLELKANPDRKARGAVIESQLDKGRGVTATVLVQKGTLSVGDPFVAGNFQGRVRALFDERNNKLDQVGPSTPALVLGFEGAPQAGDVFVVVDSEREAREISTKRQQLKREQDHRQVHLITLDQIAQQISEGTVRELPLIVKGDVDGSVEALADSLMKLSNNEVAVRVIHKGVGAITEGDVLLAAASQAIIVGFHVRPNLNAKRVAETEKVDIRLYNVIYDAINEVKSALEGMLAPVISEETVATVEVRETFKVPKVGTIAGCYVQDGKVTRNDKIRLFREGIVIYTGELAQLRRFKDDVKEVDAGYECGLNISGYNDIKVGDIVEAYKIVETKKKFED